MSNNGIAPAIEGSEFTCPHRGVTGLQGWVDTYADRITNHEVLLPLSDAGLVRIGNNLILS